MSTIYTIHTGSISNSKTTKTTMTIYNNIIVNRKGSQRGHDLTKLWIIILKLGICCEHNYMIMYIIVILAYKMYKIQKNK